MAPTIGVNLRVTGHCNQGGRKYMEDAFVVAYQQTEDEKDLEYAYFGIFDGHGGREAALFAKEHLMDFIVNQKSFWSDDDKHVLKAIRDGFITTHLAMWKEVGNWPKTVSGLPSTSGTTSSIAFIRRGKMYIGHVGDSKIVIGYQEPGCNLWLPLSLTKDHKPESPKEKKRIYSVGGLVMNKAGVERVVWNRPRIGHKGPIRRSTHFDQIPFLAVARSLGDLWSYNYLRREFVVSPEPDVSVFTLDPKRDRCIILASDGLWNMITTKDAVRIVQAAEEENEQIILEGGGPNGVGKPSNNPSKLLVDRALSNWYNLRMRADNTSVVTVLLDPPGPPKSEVLLRQKIMQKLRPRDDQGEIDGQSSVGNENNTETEEAALQRKQSMDATSAKDLEDTSSNIVKDKRKVSNPSEHRTGVLPKPVILSPQRVIVKRVIAQNEVKSVFNDQSNLTGRKFNDNQTVCNVNSSSCKIQNVNNVMLADQTKEQRKILTPDSKANINAANTSPYVSGNKCPSQINNDVKENSIAMQNARKMPFASGSEANQECNQMWSNESEMETDENLNSCLSSCSKAVAQNEANDVKSNNDVNSDDSNTERKWSVLKRKHQEDQKELDSAPSAKNVRLQSSTTTTTVRTDDSCSNYNVNAPRNTELAHNTRARVRKMKV